MLKVVKFGGSSVAGADQFRKVKDIVLADESRKIVVISASGKRNKEDHKMTDLLYLCHAHLQYGVACDDIFDEIKDRLLETKRELSLKVDIESDLEKLKKSLNKDFSRDELVSRGEYFTSRLMADFLGYTFVDAKDCVFFSFDGSVDKEKTYEAIKNAYDKYGNIVIPGFYGSMPGGRIKVMARGGSDISGSLAAAAVDADVYENWTDVSGVLMADPRIVSSPGPIAMLTYSELRELAFHGASVLQEDSVMPVREKGITLNIRNTNEPSHPGTVIVEKIENEKADERFITGVAGRKNFTILTLHKRGMAVTEKLRQVLAIMERYHIPVEHITLGLDSFSLVTPDVVTELFYEAMASISKEIEPDNMETQNEISLVAAVGRKMTFRPGVSGKLFNALGDNGINVRTIAQGADELSIVIGVDNKDYETTVRVLYDSFAG